MTGQSPSLNNYDTDMCVFRKSSNEITDRMKIVLCAGCGGLYHRTCAKGVPSDANGVFAKCCESKMISGSDTASYLPANISGMTREDLVNIINVASDTAAQKVMSQMALQYDSLNNKVVIMDTQLAELQKSYEELRAKLEAVDKRNSLEFNMNNFDVFEYERAERLRKSKNVMVYNVPTGPMSDLKAKVGDLLNRCNSAINSENIYIKKIDKKGENGATSASQGLTNLCVSLKSKEDVSSEENFKVLLVFLGSHQ